MFKHPAKLFGIERQVRENFSFYKINNFHIVLQDYDNVTFVFIENKLIDLTMNPKQIASISSLQNFVIEELVKLFSERIS